MSDLEKIRKSAIRLNDKAKLVDVLREAAKTPGGRMTDFGRGLLAEAKRAGIKQASMAGLLDISRGAVSQHYNR